jgi:hypothetical protein
MSRLENVNLTKIFHIENSVECLGKISSFGLSTSLRLMGGGGGGWVALPCKT